MLLDRQFYIDYAREHTGDRRFRHTLGVEKLAVELAKLYGEDEKKASVAAILHDTAKKMKDKLAAAQNYNIEPDEIEKMMPDLLHGPLAAAVMKRELSITDDDMLNAVAYHTTGRAGMSRLEKIIYMADLLEENRDFPGVEELRSAIRKDLDDGTLKGMAHVLSYLAETYSPICSKSIEAYNYMILEGKK